MGVADADTLSTGLRLLNFQTAGLLIGGIFWGILGDKRGRLDRVVRLHRNLLHSKHPQRFCIGYLAV